MYNKIWKVTGCAVAIAVIMSGCSLLPGFDKPAEDAVLNLVCEGKERDLYTKLVTSYQEKGLAKVNVLTEEEALDSKTKVDLVSNRVFMEEEPVQGEKWKGILEEIENLAFSPDFWMESGEIPITAEVPVVYYNKQIFEETGAYVPQSLQDFADIASVLKALGTEYPIGFCKENGKFQVEDMVCGMLNQGESWGQEEYLESDFASVAAFNVANTACNLGLNHWVIPLKKSPEDKEALFQLMRDEKCAMIFGTTKDYLIQSRENDIVGVEEVCPSSFEISVPIMQGNSIRILSDHQKNGVIDFLKFLYSPEGQQILSDSTGNLPVTVDCEYQGDLQNLYTRIKTAGIVPNAKICMEENQWNTLSDLIDQGLQNKLAIVDTNSVIEAIRKEKNDGEN